MTSDRNSDGSNGFSAISFWKGISTLNQNQKKISFKAIRYTKTTHRIYLRLIITKTYIDLSLELHYQHKNVPHADLDYLHWPLRINNNEEIISRQITTTHCARPNAIITTVSSTKEAIITRNPPQPLIKEGTVHHRLITATVTMITDTHDLAHSLHLVLIITTLRHNHYKNSQAAYIYATHRRYSGNYKTYLLR